MDGRSCDCQTRAGAEILDMSCQVGETRDAGLRPALAADAEPGIKRTACRSPRVLLSPGFVVRSAARRAAAGLRQRVRESVTNLRLICGCIESVAALIGRSIHPWPMAAASRVMPSVICSWLMPENDSRANRWPWPSTKNALPSTKLTFAFNARSNSSRSSTPSGSSIHKKKPPRGDVHLTRPASVDCRACSITLRFAW